MARGYAFSVQSDRIAPSRHYRLVNFQGCKSWCLAASLAYITLAGCGSAEDGGAAPGTAGSASSGASNSPGGNASLPTAGTRAQSAGTAAGGGGATASTGGTPSASGGPASGAGGTSSAGQSGSSAGSGSTPPTNGKPDSTLVGFASVEAFGLKTTTGGDGAALVTATTVEELAKYAAAAEPYVIQIEGTIKPATAKYQKIRVASNKTILGVGADATVEHLGFDVTGWTVVDEGMCEAETKGTFPPVSNVIIRNLNFKNTMGSSSDADGVVVQCYSHHIWIDHNTFHGLQSGPDGAIDVKRGADYVTVSWNHIQNWDKTMLLGHDDSNGAQDRGTLHVTYHHNYMQNTRQRHPRIRFAHAHVFNNFLYNDATVPNRTASYFLVTSMEASVYADGNLVHHAKEMYLNGEESDSSGKLTYTDTNKAVALNAGAESLFHIPPSNDAFNPRDFYEYTPHTADEVATVVPQGAGAGKL